MKNYGYKFQHSRSPSSTCLSSMAMDRCFLVLIINEIQAKQKVQISIIKLWENSRNGRNIKRFFFQVCRWHSFHHFRERASDKVNGKGPHVEVY